MDVPVTAQVVQVTVYPDRARVQAQGTCTLEAGTHRLLVNELPLTMETDSIRATGRGTAVVRILSVDVARQHYTVTPAAKVQELEAEIEQVQAELRVLKDDKSGWLAHAQYLDGLRAGTNEYAWGLARGRMKVTEQSALVEFLQTQDREMRAVVRDLDQQQQERQRTLQKLQRELKELQSARPRQRFQAIVDVEVVEAGEFAPALSYVVRRAGWQPLYDLRLQPATADEAASLQVSYIAQVTQNTGQDWQDVALTVSTARPALNQRLPELKPWFIDERKPLPPPSPQRKQAVRMRRAVMMDAEAPEEEEMVMVGAMAAPEPAAAEIAVADVQGSGTAVSFAVSGRVDIPSDGSPHKTTVNQFGLDADIDYLAVPKHTDAVYRRAKVINEGPGPLLQGSANLFVADEFIGKTNLGYTPTAGELELLLGVEERITVTRELTRRDVDKRFLRDNRQLRYGYKINVKNLLPTTVEVEVQDHVPVSRHEQIQVKLEAVKPQPAEKTELNLLTWHLPLETDAERELTYTFLVEHPRSIDVIGLID